MPDLNQARDAIKDKRKAIQKYAFQGNTMAKAQTALLHSLDQLLSELQAPDKTTKNMDNLRRHIDAYVHFSPINKKELNRFFSDLSTALDYAPNARSSSPDSHPE